MVSDNPAGFGKNLPAYAPNNRMADLDAMRKSVTNDHRPHEQAFEKEVTFFVDDLSQPL
jgi:hypothetical protein